MDVTLLNTYKGNAKLALSPLCSWVRDTLGESNGIPLQYSCLENPMDGGAWKAAVHGVAEGRTWLSNFTFNFHFPFSCIGEGNGNPLQCSCLENPTDGGAWWAAVCGVAQSRTWLKWLSSSSSKILLDKQKEILATSRPCIEGNSKLL